MLKGNIKYESLKSFADIHISLPLFTVTKYWLIAKCHTIMKVQQLEVLDPLTVILEVQYQTQKIRPFGCQELHQSLVIVVIFTQVWNILPKIKFQLNVEQSFFWILKIIRSHKVPIRQQAVIARLPYLSIQFQSYAPTSMQF